jgi:hypothetical protein
MTMKKITIVLAMLALSQLATAQEVEKVEAEKDTTWQAGAVLGLNFNQAYYSNWAGGGANSISSTALVNVYLKYNKDKVSWHNTLGMAYGLIRQEGATENDLLITKSEDEIDFSSKFGFDVFNNKKWNYAGLLSFKSQFAPGYKDASDSVPISDWLAPGYVIMSLGLDYVPSKDFSVLMAPLTGKITIVTNDLLSAAGAFGVAPGETIRQELGGYVKIEYTKKWKEGVLDNIDFSTKLDLFSNYELNPQNIDITWSTLVALKVNKYVSCSLSTDLVYDDEITITGLDDQGQAFSGPRTQFKQIFSLGLSYQL